MIDVCGLCVTRALTSPSLTLFLLSLSLRCCLLSAFPFPGDAVDNIMYTSRNMYIT